MLIDRWSVMQEDDERRRAAAAKEKRRRRGSRTEEAPLPPLLLVASSTSASSLSRTDMLLMIQDTSISNALGSMSSRPPSLSLVMWLEG